MKAPLAAGAAALLAAACATLPAPAGTGDWPARRAELQALADWNLRGRVALAVGADGLTGSIVWRQRGEQAQFEMRGPVGATLLAVEMQGPRFTMTDHDGRTWTGDGDTFGIQVGASVARLPLTELRYWLLGVPAPGAPHAETIGPGQRLEALEQSGWRLRYLRYRDGRDGPLPAQVEMESEGIRVRVVVSEWRLGS